MTGGVLIGLLDVNRLDRFKSGWPKLRRCDVPRRHGFSGHSCDGPHRSQKSGKMSRCENSS